MNRPNRRTPVQKPAKDLKRALSSIIKYCRPSWTWIIISIIFAVAGAVLNLIGPHFISQITDAIKDAIFLPEGVDLNFIWNIAYVLILLYVIGAILSLAQGLIMTQVTQKTTKRMRKDISHKLNRLPLKYLDSHSYGDVLSRVTNDVDTIGQTLNNSVSTLIGAVALFAGSIIMMFVTNWIMALTAIGATLLGFVLMSVIMTKSQKYFARQQRSLGNLNGHIEEVYTGHEIVKVYNGERKAKETFEKHNKELYTSGWKSQFLSGMMMPLMQFIGNFGYVAVCVVGAVLISNGTISFGVVTAFIIYIRLFTQPLSQMAQAVTSLQSAGAASERVFEILNEPEMQDETHKNTQAPVVQGNVQFNHVKFGYNPEKPVIKDFSLDVRAGQKVAIVGPTGAGKTTLVNLLMRFYEVDSGDIKIDGVSVHDLTREQVHNIFGMVLQDTWLFGGTIYENIVFNNSNITREQVIEACKSVGVDHFIRTLPQGYDTIIDENTTISAGQKQLLTIARAMVQNNPMLILDEATSSVDTRTEIVIQQAMDKLMQGRTSFVIAHRLSTIKNADIILVMQHGDIIEQGTHNELMQKESGVYKELYNSQFLED
ncbi:MAG: ABC transporter ATP-binding protein [Clostridia bacterium]|nr:ABC transporter ATP-binding protein [Clostridia bacterium]